MTSMFLTQRMDDRSRRHLLTGLIFNLSFSVFVKS
jgi:hypothetical protein